MRVTDDILFFFDRELPGLALFELLFEQTMARWPSSTLRVQKTQITFSAPEARRRPDGHLWLERAA